MDVAGASGGERPSKPHLVFQPDWPRSCAAVDEGRCQPPSRLAKLEDALDDTQFRGSGVHTADRGPVVGDYARANDIAAAVDTAGRQGYLHELGELLQVLQRRPRVHQAALVRQHGEAPHQGVLRDARPEDVDLQRVRDRLLRLTVHVCVYQSHVVVAGDAVPQRREALVQLLNLHAVRQVAADVPQLQVRGDARQEQTMPVANGHTPHDPRSADGARNDRDVLAKLGLEQAVEVQR
mmetsp:Transcript_94561/g.276341  ORF Transcript_94561/g.276341 Transcript_94561/m.276341 type:complete len:237 (+) Transcript_94561:58-768(+)